MTDHVGGVDHGTLGAFYFHGITDIQARHVLGNITLGIGLDKEVEEAGFIIGGDRGVGAKNLLGLAFDSGGKRNVLADRQAQNVGRTGETETVDGHIVRNNGLLLQYEVLEFVGF